MPVAPESLTATAAPAVPALKMVPTAITSPFKSTATPFAPPYPLAVFAIDVDQSTSPVLLASFTTTNVAAFEPATITSPAASMATAYATPGPASYRQRSSPVDGTQFDGKESSLKGIVTDGDDAVGGRYVEAS